VHGRQCGHCGLRAGANEHDPCISELPGEVMNACCGHGRTEEAYIQYHQGARYVSGVKTNRVAAALALVLMRVSHPKAGRS
jgi:hypothetical protein